MGEARELFERFRAEAHEVQTYFRDAGKSDSAYIFGGIVEALRRALATQPEPAAVPELPEYVKMDEHEDWQVTLKEGNRFWIESSLPPDDLDRIAEVCRILAARRRAVL